PRSLVQHDVIGSNRRDVQTGGRVVSGTPDARSAVQGPDASPPVPVAEVRFILRRKPDAGVPAGVMAFDEAPGVNVHAPWVHGGIHFEEVCVHTQDRARSCDELTDGLARPLRFFGQVDAFCQHRPERQGRVGEIDGNQVHLYRARIPTPYKGLHHQTCRQIAARHRYRPRSYREVPSGAPVEARTTSSGSNQCTIRSACRYCSFSCAIRSNKMPVARSAISSIGTRSVVKGGDVTEAKVSSKPVTLTSSGTRRPRS